MSVGDYDALISAAKIEIENCKSLISTINGLSSSLSNCVKELNCVASNLEQGLVIDGVAQGKTVAEKSSTIDSFRKNMDATVPELNARISQLESDIAGWEAAKQALIERLEREKAQEEASLFAKIKKTFKT